MRIESDLYTDIYVDKVVIHPNYTPPKVYNDIALLRLKTQVMFSYNLQPACLSVLKNLSQLPDPVVTATGWGHITYGKQLLLFTLTLITMTGSRLQFNFVL